MVCSAPPDCRARETISRARIVYQCRPCPILHPPPHLHPPLLVAPVLMSCSAPSSSPLPFAPLPFAASRHETNPANVLTPDSDTTATPSRHPHRRTGRSPADWLGVLVILAVQITAASALCRRSARKQSISQLLPLACSCPRSLRTNPRHGTSVPWRG